MSQDGEISHKIQKKILFFSNQAEAVKRKHSSKFGINMCILDMDEKEKLYDILWLGKIVILRISFPIQIAIRNYLNFECFEVMIR